MNNDIVLYKHSLSEMQAMAEAVARSKVTHIDGVLVRVVPGYEGRYCASEDGRVWAHPNKSRSQGRWMKPRIDNSGYTYVTLFKNGVRKYPKVHRVVLESFSGGDANPLQVNHKNGVKDDNRLENLEWMTARENRKHAFRTGLQIVSDAQRKASSANITAWNRRAQ